MSQRKLFFYWGLYTFIALLLLLCQAFLLPHLRLWHIHPFLPPCIAAVTAVYTSRRGGVIFGFFLGFLCDMLFTGVFPCFYLLVFSLCAFGAGLLSHRFISPGLLCSLLVGTLSLFVTELLQLFFLSFGGNVSFLTVIRLLFIEIVITVPFLFVLHPLYSRVNRFLANV